MHRWSCAEQGSGVREYFQDLAGVVVTTALLVPVHHYHYHYHYYHHYHYVQYDHYDHNDQYYHYRYRYHCYSDVLLSLIGCYDC